MLGLERRLPRLEEDVATLEREDDGELYGVISLQVVQNELADIMELITRLNNTTLEHQRLTHVTTTKVNTHTHRLHNTDIRNGMRISSLNKFNTVIKRAAQLLNILTNYKITFCRTSFAATIMKCFAKS